MQNEKTLHSLLCWKHSKSKKKRTFKKITLAKGLFLTVAAFLWILPILTYLHINFTAASKSEQTNSSPVQSNPIQISDGGRRTPLGVRNGSDKACKLSIITTSIITTSTRVKAVLENALTPMAIQQAKEQRIVKGSFSVGCFCLTVKRQNSFDLMLIWVRHKEVFLSIENNKKQTKICFLLAGSTLKPFLAFRLKYQLSFIIYISCWHLVPDCSLTPKLFTAM